MAPAGKAAQQGEGKLVGEKKELDAKNRMAPAGKAAQQGEGKLVGEKKKI